MLLRTTELIEEDAQARYLAARCLAEVRDWDECLSVLGDSGNPQSDVTAMGEHVSVLQLIQAYIQQAEQS